MPDLALQQRRPNPFGGQSEAQPGLAGRLRSDPHVGERLSQEPDAATAPATPECLLELIEIVAAVAPHEEVADRDQLLVRQQREALGPGLDTVAHWDSPHHVDPCSPGRDTVPDESGPAGHRPVADRRRVNGARGGHRHSPEFRSGGVNEVLTRSEEHGDAREIASRCPATRSPEAAGEQLYVATTKARVRDEGERIAHGERVVREQGWEGIAWHADSVADHVHPARSLSTAPTRLSTGSRDRAPHEMARQTTRPRPGRRTSHLARRAPEGRRPMRTEPRSADSLGE